MHDWTSNLYIKACRVLCLVFNVIKLQEIKVYIIRLRKNRTFYSNKIESSILENHITIIHVL